MTDINPIFGNLFVVQPKIEQATRELLQLWFPTYIRAIEIQYDLDVGKIPVPKAKNYTNRNNFDANPGEEIPRVVVISPGIVGTPRKSGNGQYAAIWRLGIGVASGGETEEEAKLHNDIYGAAAREIILKHGGGAIGGKIHWLDEQYVDLPIRNQLTQYRAASIWFSVDIENVATSRGGPDMPDSEPYTYHTADDVEIELNKEALA